MKQSLNKVIVDDTKNRKRANEGLDGVLLHKLHAVCVAGVSDDAEVPCVMRRFLTIRYEMSVESIDTELVEAELLDSAVAGVLA